MGASCLGASTVTDAQFINFNNKNKYQSKSGRQLSQQDLQLILKSIAPGQPQITFKSLASYIHQQPDMLFRDPNFTHIQQSTAQNPNPQSSYLPKLYNFQTLKLTRTYLTSANNLTSFVEQDVQMCYMSTVFYCISDKPDLKEKMFITTHINPHAAYIVRLHCNGECTDVVVDDSVPLFRRNLKYISITRPGEIWPFLLQKAWCKQIGNYTKAKGLSPEDCYQQMTGLPSKSFTFKQQSIRNVYDSLKQAMKKSYWVALTATSNPNIQGIRIRQVFYLQQITQQSVRIRSPFTQFQFRHKQNHNGVLQLSMNDIYAYFQYATIGAYEPGYELQSLRFKSKKDEEKIFQLSVNFGAKINVRVIQFYAEYLGKIQKQIYDYSSVLIQLYNDQFKIMDRFEGRLQNLSGVRSSNLCDELLQYLAPGKYYLRVQIDWTLQNNLNQANVVIYSPKGTTSITQLTEHNTSNHASPLDITAKLLAYSIEQQKLETVEKNKQQELSIRHVSKKYGDILCIQNLSDDPTQLKVIFKDSENIRINHHDLYDNTLHIKLDRLQDRVFQILPKDAKKKYYLKPFDIVKI